MRHCFLIALAVFFLVACSSANSGAVQTRTAATSIALQTAEAVAEETRRAELALAVETALAGTAEVEAVQTAVVATRKAMATPTSPPQLTCIEIAKSQGYWEELLDIMDRWQDAVDIALSTPRMSLAGPLADLQAIRRGADRTDAPACLTAVQDNLISAMDHSIEAFLLFMQQASDAQVNREFNKASDSMSEVTRLLEGVQVAATRQSLITPTPTGN